jgi:DNA-binding MurR/RpiR family transcriptional regulator
MLQGKDPTDKNETILKNVRSKGAKGYTDFKELLRKTWQTDLLELIVCAENGQDTTEIESRLEKTAVLSPEYIKHRGRK